MEISWRRRRSSPSSSEDRKPGKRNLGFGFRQAPSRPALGCRVLARGSDPQEAAGPGWAQARPSRPPRWRRQGQSRPTDTSSSAFRGRRAARGARCHPPGPSPAASAARESHSLLFRHLLPHPAEPPRPPSSEPGASWDRFCFRLPLEARLAGERGAGPRP